MNFLKMKWRQFAFSQIIKAQDKVKCLVINDLCISLYVNNIAKFWNIHGELNSFFFFLLSSKKYKHLLFIKVDRFYLAGNNILLVKTRIFF